jgi:hypothetical protein
MYVIVWTSYVMPLDSYTECGCSTWFAGVILSLDTSVIFWSSQILLWFFELANYFICGYNLHYFLFYWHDQSTVQLALNFLSPESLPESVRMAQEIRCLPNDHFAKLKMLEVSCDLPNYYDDLPWIHNLWGCLVWEITSCRMESSYEILWDEPLNLFLIIKLTMCLWGMRWWTGDGLNHFIP